MLVNCVTKIQDSSKYICFTFLIAFYFNSVYLFLTQKQFDKAIDHNKLVTCGNVTDPRIQVAVDIASALTLIFRSDDKNPHKGMRLLVMEINTTSYSVRCFASIIILCYYRCGQTFGNARAYKSICDPVWENLSYHLFIIKSIMKCWF